MKSKPEKPQNQGVVQRADGPKVYGLPVSKEIHPKGGSLSLKRPWSQGRAIYGPYGFGFPSLP